MQTAWRNVSNENGAQVDLIIDRRDQIINLCEMKFSINTFAIDKNYADELRNKISVFKQVTGTRKTVLLTMITTYGLKANSYSSLIQNSLTMDALFHII